MTSAYAEYDALLEEPFGEDIDWAAFDLQSQAALAVVPTNNPPPPTVNPFVSSNSVSVNESTVSNSHNDVIIISSSPSDKPPPSPSPKKTRKSKRSKASSESPLKDQKNSEPYPCNCEKRKRVKKKKYLRAIESMLECTICFNIIAAAYSLPCGHTACAICLHTWLDSNKSCFICREPFKGIFVPNFSVDQLAEMHFKNKPNMDDKEAEEYHQWLSRAESGKQKIQSRQSRRSNPRRTTARR